jgi:hypothetical protein
MKLKKFSKKLKLNKKTIINLNINEMSKVYGGVSKPITECTGCFTYCGQGGAMC